MSEQPKDAAERAAERNGRPAMPDGQVAPRPYDVLVDDSLSPALAQTRDALSEHCGDRITWEPPFRGQLIGVVLPAHLLDVLTHLKTEAEPRYRMLSDITAVDLLRHRGAPRFDVVYQLVCPEPAAWLRLKVPVDEGEAVPTATRLWRGANFMEREVFDMFGIPFRGHPNLTRLLMPEDYQGHPLRRDHGIGDVPVDFDLPHRKRYGHA